VVAELMRALGKHVLAGRSVDVEFCHVGKVCTLRGKTQRFSDETLYPNVKPLISLRLRSLSHAPGNAIRRTNCLLAKDGL
jgi:hypothetical protein